MICNCFGVSCTTKNHFQINPLVSIQDHYFTVLFCHAIYNEKLLVLGHTYVQIIRLVFFMIYNVIGVGAKYVQVNIALSLLIICGDVQDTIAISRKLNIMSVIKYFFIDFVGFKIFDVKICLFVIPQIYTKSYLSMIVAHSHFNEFGCLLVLVFYYLLYVQYQLLFLSYQISSVNYLVVIVPHK